MEAVNAKPAYWSAEDQLLNRIPGDALYKFYAVYVANHGRLPQVVIDSLLSLWERAETAEDYLQAMEHAHSAGLGQLDAEGEWQWLAS